MMAFHRLCICFLLLCLYWGCGPDYDGFTEVIVDQEFSREPPIQFAVHLPDYMHEGRLLDSKFSPSLIYYVDRRTQTYFAVREQEKFQSDWLQNTEENFGMTSTELTVRSGLKTIGYELDDPQVREFGELEAFPGHSFYAEVTGPYTDLPRFVFTYKLAIIETQHYFYEVFAWTSNENNPTFEVDMDKAVRSFRELE